MIHKGEPDLTQRREGFGSGQRRPEGPPGSLAAARKGRDEPGCSLTTASCHGLCAPASSGTEGALLIVQGDGITGKYYGCGHAFRTKTTLAIAR